MNVEWCAEIWDHIKVQISFLCKPSLAWGTFFITTLPATISCHKGSLWSWLDIFQVVEKYQKVGSLLMSSLWEAVRNGGVKTSATLFTCGKRQSTLCYPHPTPPHNAPRLGKRFSLCVAVWPNSCCSTLLRGRICGASKESQRLFPLPTPSVAHHSEAWVTLWCQLGTQVKKAWLMC